MTSPDIVIRSTRQGIKVEYQTEKGQAFRDSYFAGRTGEDWPSLAYFQVCAQRAGLTVDFEVTR